MRQTKQGFLQKIPRLSLLIWSILILLASFIYGYIETQNRNATRSFAGFFAENWRNGLTSAQTLWDGSLFWGEFWFNLILALFMALFWLKKAPPSQEQLWKSSESKIFKTFIISLSICAGIFVLMQITYPIPDTFWNNWYPTHFAYQLPAWPAIIASILLILAPMKKYKEVINEKWNSRGKWIIWGCITAIWLLMALQTIYDPHVLFNFEIQLQTWIFTMSFPVAITIFFATFLLKDPPKRKDGDVKKEFPILIACILIFAILQFISALIPEGVGEGQIFSLWILWWWPFAHWPGWIFSGSLAISIISGARYFNIIKQKRKLLGSTTQTSSDDRKTGSTGEKIIEMFNNAADYITNPSKINTSNAKKIIGCLLGIIILVPMVQVASYNTDVPLVLVNQVGYLPDGMKHVVFQAPTGSSVPDDAEFNIRKVSDDQIVYTGNLTKYGDHYQHWYMDGYFTEFNTSGNYYIDVTYNSEVISSHTFEIGDQVYDLTRDRAVDFFYYQRCGYDVQEIVEGYAGHEACHLDDAMVWNGSELVYYNLSGGWHDAGDYNKYNTWFFTQWFCVRSLGDAWEGDTEDYYENIEDQYDSSAPDVLDEALWGANFLVKCTDTKGMREDTKGMVFRKVVDWNYADNRSALMSYWGPPDQNTDNIPETGDERVVYDNSENPTYWGYASAESGYGFAGGLMHTARLIDDYIAANPEFHYPSWSVNTTVMRETADLLNSTYYPFNTGTHIYSKISRLYYEQEVAIYTDDYTNANQTASELLNLVDADNHNWIHSYALARLMEYYLETGFEIPSNVLTKAYERQTTVFDTFYVGPFQVLNGYDANDELRLFGRPGFAGYHGVINFERYAQIYFQILYSAVNPSEERIDLFQYELDYTFGINPLALCQMDGVGGDFVNQIHHRYGYAYNPGGRVAGGIINGIVNVQPTESYALLHGYEGDMSNRFLMVPEEAWVDYWEPSPFRVDGVDSNCNEIWIPHDAVYLEMINAYLNYI